MLLKLLIKIWPALTPIFLYIFWVIIRRIIFKLLNKKNYINANYSDLDNDNPKNTISPYSLKNKQFIFVIYLSLIFLIISFLSFALTG
jgi:hypothetical protein